MKNYAGNSAGDMSVKVKDYQPSSKEFAGEMPGKTTEYVSRTDRHLSKDAGNVRKQAFKGRYD